MIIVTAEGNFLRYITENKNKTAASLHNWQRKGVNMELETILEDMCDHYCKHAASDISLETLHDICNECPLSKLATEDYKSVTDGM